MTDEKKKDDKDGKDAKKIDDEQLKDVAGGTGPRKASATFQIVLDEKTGDSTSKYDITTHAGEK